MVEINGMKQLQVWGIHFVLFCIILAYCLITSTVIYGLVGVAYLITGILIGVEGINGVVSVVDEL